MNSPSLPTQTPDPPIDVERCMRELEPGQSHEIEVGGVAKDILLKRLREAGVDTGDQATGKGCAPPGSITVASAPLDDRDDTPKGFYLRRIESTLWLRGYRSWSGHRWSCEDVFAFVRSSEANP